MGITKSTEAGAVRGGGMRRRRAGARPEGGDERKAAEVEIGRRKAAAGQGAGAGASASGLRGWVARARGAGLSVSEMVLELHVRQGVPLLGVAGALGVSFAEVGTLWEEVRAGLARRAAKQEGTAGMEGMREHIGAVLWRTVEVTFPEVALGAVGVGDGEGDSAAAADDDAAAAAAAGLGAGGAAVAAPMLSVRLKALDQLTKLYDLNLSRTAEEDAAVPYAAPAEIAQSVRERVLEMWGR